MSQANKVIALLPMKGHSERVPNKNIRDFCGRPLFHWVLESLLKSHHISDVVINTDSPLIAEDAKKHFPTVLIIERPESICGDFVSMNEIINYDLSQTNGEHFFQTHSTNPLLTTETINDAINNYFNKLMTYDSLFAVTKLQTRLYWGNGTPVNHDPNVLIRTQDLTPIYEENSNFYLFSRESFYSNENKRIGRHPQMFEVDRLEAIDIDELHDFKVAEILCSLKSEKE